MDAQKDTKGERTYVAEAFPPAPQKYFACGLAEDWYTGPSKPAPTASTWQNRSWSSSVSIMSDYRLEDRGSIPRQRQRTFPLASVSRPALSPPSLMSNGYRESFPGRKAQPGRDADHSTPSSTEVKNEYGLYFLSPLGPAQRVAGQLCFTFTTWRNILYHLR
jgi:hypothetical protein